VIAVGWNGQRRESRDQAKGETMVGASIDADHGLGAVAMFAAAET
jgi:hypothetical protein